jgi:hypothetical protein
MLDFFEGVFIICGVPKPPFEEQFEPLFFGGVFFYFLNAEACFFIRGWSPFSFLGCVSYFGNTKASFSSKVGTPFVFGGVFLIFETPKPYFCRRH